jgi:hypothetical protein
MVFWGKTEYKLAIKIKTMKTLKNINQLKYPKEFRIFPVRLETESLKHLETLISTYLNELKKSPEPKSASAPNKEFLAEVSVGAWRLMKKMTDPINKQPLEEMSRAYRHLESILLTLKNEGIEIQDHDGQKFDAGLSLKVLAYQPTPNLESEFVLETIKPSIYLFTEPILMGEVIVATFDK